LQKSGIDWSPITYAYILPVLSAIWNIWRLRLRVFALHRKKNFAMVHSRSYVPSIVVDRLKQKHGVKFLFDMRGFYADERVDGGLWKQDNPIYKAVYQYFKRKEIDFLTHADYIVTLTNKGKEIIHSRTDIPGQPLPIEVIPCCANLDLFSPQSVDPKLLTELRNKFSLKGDEFVLSYLGSLGTWYMPDEMMDFFHCLLEHKPDARFLFITHDPMADILAEAASRNIPVNNVIVAFARHHEVPTYLALSSASIFFIKPLFSKKASSPTKQAEIMGMGIPEVCNSGVGDVDEIMDEKCGVLVKQFIPADYERAVKQLLSATYNPAYIRQRADDIYSLKHGVQRFSKIYQHILATQ
jgi:glycosyltransferase involved in cell wall biosynthesis